MDRDQTSEVCGGPRITDHTPGALEALGLTRAEEAVYLMLLDNPDQTAAQLARISGGRQRLVYDMLATLEATGLVSRLPARPPRFRPSPPRAAIEAVLLGQQQKLERARLVAINLEERQRRGRPAASALDELVEVVIGEDTVAQRVMQLQQSARQELVGFDRPPYSTTQELSDAREEEAIAKGVSVRAVYDPDGLTAEVAAAIQAMVRIGEHARTAPVPTKLIIADRRVALLPLRVEELSVESALIVYPSPLLDTLVDEFERVWKEAADLHGSSKGRALTLPTQQLLTLLAAGHSDGYIAQQLHVTERTVGRRIHALMSELGARSRFQLGLLASQRGWLD